MQSSEVFDSRSSKAWFKLLRIDKYGEDLCPNYVIAQKCALSSVVSNEYATIIRITVSTDFGHFILVLIDRLFVLP